MADTVGGKNDRNDGEDRTKNEREQMETEWVVGVRKIKRKTKRTEK